MSKEKWILDNSHSSVDFSVKHMVIAKVKGTFTDFSADVALNPNDLTDADVQFSIGLNSIDTRNVDRDNHLRSADFLDVENHPTMTFVSTNVKRLNENTYELIGNLTLRGITHTEVFIVAYEGAGKDPWGNEKIGFSANGKIDRTKYGLVWNAALETGGVLVGENIDVLLELELSK